MRAAKYSYGGMTAAEHAARLDAWGQEMLAAFARQTPQEREAKRLAWRMFWDDLHWQATQRLAARAKKPTKKAS